MALLCKASLLEFLWGYFLIMLIQNTSGAASKIIEF